MEVEEVGQAVQRFLELRALPLLPVPAEPVGLETAGYGAVLREHRAQQRGAGLEHAADEDRET